MKRSILGAITALFLFAGVASAHTGSLTVDQTCFGYTISAHLNADVSKAAGWAVTLNTTLIARGTGPGPTDLGPYTGPVTSGVVSFAVSISKETHTYQATLPSVGECPTPTPSATSTPSATPSIGPRPTPPSTDTTSTTTDNDVQSQRQNWLGILALAGIVGFVIIGLGYINHINKRP